uniref:Uncharacterized protein n=1 Tax=viral metagenome TaxID=1070528 RepID=A0A6C0C730_9ZZZZ
MSRYIGLCHPKGCDSNIYYIFWTTNPRAHVLGLSRAARKFPNLACNYIILNRKRIFAVNESQTRVAYSKDMYDKSTYDAVVSFFAGDRPVRDKKHWPAITIQQCDVTNLLFDDIIKNVMTLKE